MEARQQTIGQLTSGWKLIPLRVWLRFLGRISSLILTQDKWDTHFRPILRYTMSHHVLIPTFDMGYHGMTLFQYILCIFVSVQFPGLPQVYRLVTFNAPASRPRFSICTASGKRDICPDVRQIRRGSAIMAWPATAEYLSIYLYIYLSYIYLTCLYTIYIYNDWELIMTDNVW